MREQLEQQIDDGTSVILATGIFLDKDQPPRTGFLVITSQIVSL